MNNMILCAILAFLFGGLICLPMRNISNKLEDLNSKIDKIVIFLDLDLNGEEVSEWERTLEQE